MLKRLSILSALVFSATLTGGCAWLRPGPALPLLTLPDLARRPCVIPLVPPEPTQGDLDAVLIQRGAEIVKCDAARQAAVDAFDAQQGAVKAAAED